MFKPNRVSVHSTVRARMSSTPLSLARALSLSVLGSLLAHYLAHCWLPVDRLERRWYGRGLMGHGRLRGYEWCYNL